MSTDTLRGKHELDLASGPASEQAFHARGLLQLDMVEDLAGKIRLSERLQRAPRALAYLPDIERSICAHNLFNIADEARDYGDIATDEFLRSTRPLIRTVAWEFRQAFVARSLRRIGADRSKNLVTADTYHSQALDLIELLPLSMRKRMMDSRLVDASDDCDNGLLSAEKRVAISCAYIKLLPENERFPLLKEQMDFIEVAMPEAERPGHIRDTIIPAMSDREGAQYSTMMALGMLDSLPHQGTGNIGLIVDFMRMGDKTRAFYENNGNVVISDPLDGQGNIAVAFNRVRVSDADGVDGPLIFVTATNGGRSSGLLMFEVLARAACPDLKNPYRQACDNFVRRVEAAQQNRSPQV